MSDKIKGAFKDRFVSKLKNDTGEELLQKGGLIAGTLYGMKKHNMNLGKALTTTGLIGAGAGTLAGGIGIGATRLHNLHKKELGINPDKKDYAKVVAVNAIPAGIGFGALAKNRDKLEPKINEGIEKAKKLKSVLKNPEELHNLINELKSKAMVAKQVEGAASGSNNKMKALKAGLISAGIFAGTELPSLLITPETIVNKKKEEMNNMEKSAFEIIEEAYEKIAREAKEIPGTPEWEKDKEKGEEKDENEEKKEKETSEKIAGDEELSDDAKEKLHENRTRFGHDRLLSVLKDGVVGGIGGSAIGAIVGRGNPVATQLGGLAGDAAVSSYRLTKQHEKEFGEKPSARDYAKNIATRPLGLFALTNTPEAIVKAKKREQIKQEDREKSAFEVVEDAFDKIAGFKWTTPNPNPLSADEFQEFVNLGARIDKREKLSDQERKRFDDLGLRSPREYFKPHFEKKQK
jgi:hypothetical protein